MAEVFNCFDLKYYTQIQIYKIVYMAYFSFFYYGGNILFFDTKKILLKDNEVNIIDKPNTYVSCVLVF